MLFRNTFLFLLMVVAVSLVASNVVHADDAQPTKDGDQAEQDQPSDDAEEEFDDGNDPELNENFDLAQRWLERLRGNGRRNPNEKSHDSIKAAFKDISGPASESIALVFSGAKPKAIGTIVSADGFILTKASELGDELSCRLKDGRQMNATLIGVHRQHDIAMLKIEADNLTPVEFAPDAKPIIGSWLVTPGIEDTALAIGVVSVNPRKIRQMPGILGVSLDDGEGGAKINEVMPRSAAQDAGMKVGDTVLSVNGKRTPGREAMVREIRKHQPGDEVTLKVRRDDAEIALIATLGSHFTAGPAARGNFQNNLGGSLSFRRAGFEQAIQHDTVLEPHECGGPVLNLDGKAIGINIARAGRVASYALPASLVVAVLDDLKSGKLAVAEPSEKLNRITELKREIQEMTGAVNEAAAKQAAAKKRMQQAKEVLKAAQKSKKAAEKAAAASRKAVDEATAELEKVQAELEALEAEDNEDVEEE